MSKRIIIKKEQRDSLSLRDYTNLKKRVGIIGILLILAVGYIFVMTRDRQEAPSDPQGQTQEQSEPNAGQENPSAITPVEGGTLHLAVNRFASVNPFKNTDASLDQFLHLVYDALFELDESYNLQGELASSYSFSEDAKQLSVQLRSDALWHDGSRVTAQDVVYTISQIKANSQSPYSTLVSNISTANAVGNSVVLTLGTPNALEVYKLIFPIIKQNPGSGAVLSDGTFTVVGNGRFVISGYEKGKQITLKRNERYYGTKPYIDTIDVHIYRNDEIRSNMFISGDIDIIGVGYYDQGKYDYDIFRSEAYQGRRFDFIAFHSGKSPFDQGINRNAVARMIDLQAAVEDAYRGNLLMSCFPIHNGSELNLINQQIFDKESQRRVKLIAYDGHRLQILADKDDPMRHRMAYMIKDDLSKSGIDSDVVGLSGEELNAAMQQGAFDIGVFSYQAPINKDITRLHKTHPELFSFDFTQINEAMNQVYSAPSKYARSERYEQVQKQMMERMPYLGIGFRSEYTVYNRRVEGNLTSTGIELYHGIENLFIPNQETE